MTLSIRGFSLVGLIFLLGIAGQWLGNSVEYIWLFAALLYLLLVVLECSGKSTQYVDFQLETIADVSPGDTIRQNLVITNHSSRECSLDYQLKYFDVVSAKAEIKRRTITENNKVIDEICYVPLTMGRVVLADYYVRVLGRFGLVWWHKRISGQDVINIVPSRVASQISRAGMQREGLRASKSKASMGYELLSHRDYQHGDPIQSIDWKATARRQKKMVRVTSNEQRIELVILLDCGRTSQLQVGKLSQLFHNVNIAARLSDTALQYGDHVACISYAEKPLSIMPLNAGNKARKKLQVLLKNVTTQKTESNILAAALQARRLLGHRGLVVVLTDLHSGDVHSQFAQAMKLLSDKHQTLIASLDDQSILDMRWHAATHWLDPYKNLSAIEFARERKLIKMRLKQSGTNVITASPDELDRTVMKYYQQLRLKAAV